jgi:phage terminase large subunit-like protein
LPNGSELWFGGLDDKERTEKILGQEYATIFLNECSQIPWSARGIAVTRLAQNVLEKVEGKADRPLPLKMIYDENPPDKGHWSYRVFVLGQDPETKVPLANPGDFAAMQINPRDNLDNLPSTYIATLEGLSGRLQRRFLDGAFREATPGALFPASALDQWRVTDGQLPDMVRLVIAVDPSGSGEMDNAENDAIGIVVAGLGTDGIGYCIEDLTVKAGPATWGRVATSAYERHSADVVVGEVNYGGAMVRQVIQTARPNTNFRAVTATRGKVVRAEPMSSLVETGKIRMVGRLPELEEELGGFTTNGYTGESSPNRADAFVWAFAELFPSMVTDRSQKFDFSASAAKGVRM